MTERTHHNAPPMLHSDTQGPLLQERLQVFVEERPLIAAIGAGAIGAVLGGLIFSRLGRLVFLAAVGYVANELWDREGRIDIPALLTNLSAAPSGGR
ncbi:MAG: hypothetical protein ABSC94_04630 [Polyangiaceae bacterium]